jgi:hypothetical protein
VRLRLVVEFLKEYHGEPVGERGRLLAGMPEPVGDERWDVLFAGLAEHLAMRDGQDAPPWSASRGLKRFWFPFCELLRRPGRGSGGIQAVARVSQIESGDVSTQDVLSRFVAALGGTLKLIADFGDEQLKLA